MIDTRHGGLGWLAWGWVGDSTTEASQGYLYGYPGDGVGYGGCGDAGGCNGQVNGCFTPSIWGWGNHTLDADWSYRLNHSIDATGGQSGSGIYIKESSGTRRVIATTTGCQNNFFGDYDYGRRLDSDAITFIRNLSAL